MTYTELKSTDLGAMEVLEQNCFSQPWNQEQLRGSLQGKGAMAFGIWQDQTLIGSVLARIIIDEAELLSIAVHKDFRRQGLGRQLLVEFLRRCLKFEVQRVFLEVRADNGAALELYLNHGFQILKKLPGYYGAEGDGLLMGVLLEP